MPATVEHVPELYERMLGERAYFQSADKPSVLTPIETLRWLWSAAAHQNTVTHDGLIVSRGEIVTGLTDLAREWGWTTDAVEEHLLGLARSAGYWHVSRTKTATREVIRIRIEYFDNLFSVWDNPDEDFGISVKKTRVRRTRLTSDYVTRGEKRRLSDLRRREFNSARARLMLAMFAVGMKYICAHEGCGKSDRLHVDHKIALSRGGSDDVGNLQFLCPRHNSQKGDR